MYVALALYTTLLIFGFLSRNLPLTLVTLLGIVRDSKKQFPKQLSVNVSTDEGIVIFFNCLQPLMKKEGKLIRFEDSCKDSSATHSLKQYCPI